MARTRMKKESKLCARCLETLPLDDFGDNLKMKSGKKSYCRSCEKKLKELWKARQARKRKGPARRKKAATRKATRKKVAPRKATRRRRP